MGNGVAVSEQRADRDFSKNSHQPLEPLMAAARKHGFLGISGLLASVHEVCFHSQGKPLGKEMQPCRRKEVSVNQHMNKASRDEVGYCVPGPMAKGLPYLVFFFF